MNKFEAEAFLRALTGGDTPGLGETIIFSAPEGDEQNPGWRYASPLEPLAIELGLTVAELTALIRVLSEA
jgi:hypothetical protein